jgi:hypothetical protein
LIGEEIVVTLDRDGVDALSRALAAIRQGGHEHLATPSWAGTELSETPLNGGMIVHQVTFGVRRLPA